MSPLSEATIETGSGREALARTRAILDPFLHAAVDTIPGSIRPVAGYHLGWLDETGRAAAADQGKAVRPALALLAAEAVGGTAEAALPAAAAVELVHNFSLIHDDIIDNDDTRRHRQTAWRVFGVGSALLTGNALLVLAYDVIAQSRNAAAPAGGEMLSAAVLGVLDGQAKDLSFERRDDVGMTGCMDMVGRKTGALMGCACALGGLFGGGSRAQVDHLRSFGRHLGFAFQFVDDLLGIWGVPAATGKPVWSDLESRKKTLPVVAALVSGTAAGSELASIYAGTQPLPEADLVRAAACIEQAGARSWCEAQVEVFVSRALYNLELAASVPPALEQLRSLAHLIRCQDR